MSEKWRSSRGDASNIFLGPGITNPSPSPPAGAARHAPSGSGGAFKVGTSEKAADRSPPMTRIIRCPYENCTKEFTKMANFRSHERVHTGECPYICELCSKRFKWQSSLKSHRKSHRRRAEQERRFQLQPPRVAQRSFSWPQQGPPGNTVRYENQGNGRTQLPSIHHLLQPTTGSNPPPLSRPMALPPIMIPGYPQAQQGPVSWDQRDRYLPYPGGPATNPTDGGMRNSSYIRRYQNN